MKRRDESGFVLPAAIGALVIIALLVTAGFMVSQQELRMGVANRHSNIAFNIAQAGANEVMANWNGYQLSLVPPWQETTVSQTYGNIGQWEVTIRNANNFVYFITSTGRVTNAGIWSGAERTIGIATKILYVDIDPPGALTTRGDVKVSGTAEIDGFGEVPPNWGGMCAGISNDDMPGIVHDGSGTIKTGGGGLYTGSPSDDQVDPSIIDETFTDFGNLTWAELVAIAQIEGKDITSEGKTVNGPQPVVDGNGDCDQAPLLNWGDPVDPTNPCGAYFPLIYHGGDVDIQSGAIGQGLLLVEGNLGLQGNFLFHGVIITQGQFSTGGNGNRVIGAVMASNGLDIDQPIGGGSEITYSRCAVTRAILNNANLSRARPIAERSWIDLTAVVN